MPDITVSFTDAQWTRIVAATTHVIREDEGVVDADKLAAKFKDMVTSWVKGYEQANASTDNF
jgi:hypothetical protein